MINLRKNYSWLVTLLCESSDIILALTEIKECLKIFRKQLLATFYLIKKFYHAKNKNKKLVIFLIKSTHKEFIFLLKTKIWKIILDDKKIFSIKEILWHKKCFSFFLLRQCLVVVNMKNSWLFFILFRTKNEVHTQSCAKKKERQKINNSYWNREW